MAVGAPGRSPFGIGVGMSTAAVSQFALALRDPFHPHAIGVRVPDSYAIPTVTYHVRGSVSLTSDANGVIGGAFLPSPSLTFVLSDGTVTGGLLSFTANTGVKYVSSPTAMQAVLTEYRVVSWGLRFVPKDTAFAAKGKYYLAFVPTTANAPSWNTLETVSATNLNIIGEYLCGFPLGNGNLQGIVNHPSVRTFTAQDLMRGEVMVSGLPLTPSYYDFKGTSDRTSNPWGAGLVLADEGVFNHTTGLVNATAGGRKDVASIRGGMALLFTGLGCPALTQEIDVEYVYHLEGTPNIGNNGGALVPSSQKVTVGSSDLVEKALAMAHTAGHVMRFVQNPIGTLVQGLAQSGGTRPIKFAA